MENKGTIALVGASTLLGREIKRSAPRRLLDTPEWIEYLNDLDGEPALPQSVTQASFKSAAVALFACDAKFARE